MKSEQYKKPVILGGGWRDVVRAWVGDAIRDTNTSPSFFS
jgi:hypothetical protein